MIDFIGIALCVVLAFLIRRLVVRSRWVKVRVRPDGRGPNADSVYYWPPDRGDVAYLFTEEQLEVARARAEKVLGRKS